MGSYNAYLTLSGATDAEILQNERLARHTSYRVGGPADLWATCNTPGALSYVINVLREEGVPWVILGKGSNVLASDEGFRGCVVVLGREFRRVLCDADTSRITAGAAASLAGVVNTALSASLEGLERCVGVPGSLGGAIAMNAGLRDEWIGEVVRDVVVLRPGLGMHRYGAHELEWGYRHVSIPTGEVVLEATLQLADSTKAHVSAGMERRLVRRRSTQPLSKASCGSVFRNPEGDSAGRLIEECGLKGYSVGGASVSDIHANFIVNNGGATASDIAAVIRTVHDKVREVHGIDLQTEVRFLGFPS